MRSPTAPIRAPNVREGQTHALKPREFEQIRRLAHEKVGLDLRHGKEELVAARLGKLIRSGGFGSFDEYYRFVVLDASGEALTGMIDALATNFTSFLREPKHFDFLVAEVLPGWMDRGEIRVWSAACSTGEEPYTLALTLLDKLPEASHGSIRILATDISTRALDAARQGVYPKERFRDFPSAWLPKYLLRGEGRSAGFYRVKPEVQRRIEFRRLNLIEPFSHPRPFAAIFCRNVMIHFDKLTQAGLVERLAACLEPGGYLFVGHAESLAGARSNLECVRPAVYRKPAGSPPACVGGLLHFMLPESKIDARKAQMNPSMFADTGIPMLFHRAYELGAVKSRLVVRAAGAAQVFDDAGVFNIGKRNYLALRRILWGAGVMLRGEATGGTTSRTVKLEVGNGRMWCRAPGQPDQQFDRSIAPSKGVLECHIVS